MITAGYGLGSSLVFLMVLQLGGAVGSFGGALVADRRGGKPVVPLSFGAAVLALGLVAAKPPVVLLYVGLLIVGAGSIGSLNLLMAYIGVYYPQRIRGSGIGMVLAVGRMLGAAGPTIGGVLVAAGATARDTLLVFAAAPMIALLVGALGPRVSPAGPIVR
jgi:AAHS family benzoate transporter-like MFS transporter